MKFSYTLAALATLSIPASASELRRTYGSSRGARVRAATGAWTGPYVERRQSNTSATAVTDTDVLQYALTLEHLENVYYKQALGKFAEKDFTDAGFSTDFYNNVKNIAHDEEAHTVFLTQTIQSSGGSPVGACSYNFGNSLDNVKNFVALGSVLEGVGVSAYLGGAPVVQSKTVLAAAGGVLVSEGIHQGVHRQALGEVSSANIAGTALSPNSVLTIASPFLATCPPTNAPLPFKANAILNSVTASPVAPNATQVFDAGGPVPGSFFVTYVSGLSAVSVSGANVDGGKIQAIVPTQAQGQSYVFITNSQVQMGQSLQDTQVMFGPAIIEVTPDAPTIDNSIMKRHFRS